MSGMRHETDLQLFLYSDGGLDPDEREAVAAHLGGCPECRRRVESYQTLREWMAAAPESLASPEELRKRLNTRPEAPSEPRVSLLPFKQPAGTEESRAIIRQASLQRGTTAFPAFAGRRKQGAVAVLTAAALLGSGTGLWVAQGGSLPFLPASPPEEAAHPLESVASLPPPVIGQRVFAPGGELEVEILPGQRGGVYTGELRLVSPGPARTIGLDHDAGKIVKLGPIPRGSELLFEVHVRDSGNTFRIGPAERNPDGMAHSAAQLLPDGEAIIGFEDISKGGDGRYPGPDNGYNDVLFYLKRPSSPPLTGKYIASLPMPGMNWEKNRPVGAGLTAMARLGGKVISDGRALAVEVYQASGSAYNDEFSLVSPGPPKPLGTNRDVGRVVPLGKFPKGTELIFEMRNPATGKVYRTGPASRNADGIPHAAVQAGRNGEILVGFEDIDKEGNDRFPRPDYNYEDLLFRVFPVDTP
jgi:hypothetical protein